MLKKFQGNKAPVTAEDGRKSIRELKRGNPDAMLLIYDLYGALLYSVIFQAVQDRASAEDLLQETLFSVWNHVHTFDEEAGNLSGWLVTIARNRAFEHLRSLNGNRHSSSSGQFCLDHLASSPAPENTGISPHAVADSLARLTPAQREVIALTHFQGMSRTAIANRFDQPLGAAHQLVHSAIGLLSAALDSARTESNPSVPKPLAPA